MNLTIDENKENGGIVRWLGVVAAFKLKSEKLLSHVEVPEMAFKFRVRSAPDVSVLVGDDTKTMRLFRVDAKDLVFERCALLFIFCSLFVTF